MANDNILAALTGAAEGVKGVLVPWIEAKHNAQLQDQLMRSRSQEELQSYKTRLPWDEASKQRLSQVNIPPDIGADFGIPPGNIDRELLPLYGERMKNKAAMSEKTGKLTEQEQKHQDDLEKQYRALYEKGLSNRSGGLGLQDAKVNQAAHVRGLLDQYYDKNTGTYKVPKSGYTDLALGVANLVSGGNGATEGTKNDIMQRTAVGDINGLRSYISGSPKSASTDEVFKVLADSVDRQGLLADKLRNTYYEQMKSKAPTRLANERKAQVEKEIFGTSYADILKNSQATRAKAVNSAPQVETDHNAALDWANANPTDPRAAAIKAKATAALGGK